jgi:hypothetical protein
LNYSLNSSDFAGSHPVDTTVIKAGFISDERGIKAINDGRLIDMNKKFIDKCSPLS